MPLNLGKLSGQSLVDKEVSPREIFNLLPDKDPKYKYPRDVQSQVWERWMSRRNDRDLVVKMNTGGGKTIVGLLMLKSCLNEGVGPAVYVTPDKYLTRQVLKEAADMGISVTTDHTSGAFLQGKAILVTNIFHLVNGLSVFGTTDTGTKIPLGVVLIDDAHACLATTESQFTLSVDSGHEIYAEVLKLFRDDLLAQNDTKLLELEDGAPDTEMLVPFWAWHAKSTQVAKIMTEHRQDDKIKFNWPLIKNHLDQSRCVISGSKLEISPRCLPIEAIPSFTDAKRRIFLTATLSDDSILVSDFNARPEMVVDHITPNVANDIGDRMILVPQEIDPELSEKQIKEFLKEKSKIYNTVVIVPSDFRVTFWKDVADLVVTAANLEDAVDQLKKGHVGLVVMVNKYDGIDLPGSACRILVLDGLPQARRLYERIETNMLAGSRHIVAKQIQRIEQGMGRGIRANDDYCVVLLMGASLIKTMFLMDAKQLFSPATRAQIEKSLEVAGQLEGGIGELDEAIEVCLNQSSEWKKVAREAVANLTYPDKGNIRSIAVAQRAAFDAASIRNYKVARQALQDVIRTASAEENNYTIGWLKWQLAEYVQYTDGVEAQQILKAALEVNRRVTRPLDGVDYEKLKAKDLIQARNAAWKLRAYEGKANSLLVHINGILDELNFAPGNANTFEAAMQQLAEFLGFLAQRPEIDFNSGPDVLWAVGNLQYFVIECKSGATVDTVTKTYANQLSGSMNWFGKRYDQSCTAIAVLVHPSRTFEAAATPHPTARVITLDTLPAFKDAVRSYIKAAAASLETLDAKRTQQLLEHENLTPERLLANFTLAPKSAK
ncbi:MULTISPECIES: DEAD/DEAH box helicase [unclassified Variovorax]|uniref:DEAD/DEAH box helicase n=1 Tax=unclassified Variovorax TaxID=663243 RepID=UPI003F4628BD